MAKVLEKYPRRPVGRPPKGPEAMLTPITIRFPPAMMAAIEEIINKRLDRPEKGAVVRELIAEALSSRGIHHE